MNYSEICGAVRVFASVHPQKPRPVSITKKFVNDLILSAKLNEWVYYIEEDVYRLLVRVEPGVTLFVWVSIDKVSVEKMAHAAMAQCLASEFTWAVNAPRELIASLYYELQKTLHKQERSIRPTTGPFPPAMLKKLESRNTENTKCCDMPSSPIPEEIVSVEEANRRALLDHCLDYDTIIDGYVNLVGRILTILDAAYNNPAQNKAVKRLVRNEFNERMTMIRDFLFPKAEDAPQRELPSIEQE